MTTSKFKREGVYPLFENGEISFPATRERAPRLHVSAIFLTRDPIELLVTAAAAASGGGDAAVNPRPPARLPPPPRLPLLFPAYSFFFINLATKRGSVYFSPL
ncbi:hypothetical protein EVAR_81592_1 [Eumeta japonica]|uniref:Uncharacterized protein n=1 Tax=Eumeta variegata TaxID=151549 RepID=A0A4C1WEW7_EUMVA|nr:hypothetical protein EVAR_81592_1 [Eumeta japonica]